MVKHKRVIQTIFLLLLNFFLVIGCSTEVDLGGPYEEVTIVYGLLDQTEEEHVFRINKAFKGEGNSFLVAQMADSSQYKKLKAKVEEIKDGKVEREWELESFMVDEKEEGDFYNKDVIMYRFFEDNLNDESDYRLRIEVNSKELSAETSLVKDFRVLPPLSFPSSEIVLAANSSGSNKPKYTNVRVQWESSKFAARFDLVMVFSYLEVYEDGDSIKKDLPINLGSSYPTSLNGTEKLEASINGQQFYDLLKTEIKGNGKEDVLKRIPLGLDFIFLVAGKDLNTYIEVNMPSDNIIESKPLFTNVNNGFGVFSSRFKKSVKGKRLNKFSTKELCEGNITGDLKFCSDRTQWQDESFYCK